MIPELIPRIHKCLINADRVSREIHHMVESTQPYELESDGQFISGVLFTFQESGLINFPTHLVDMKNALEDTDLEKYRRTAHSAAEMIESIKC